MTSSRQLAYQVLRRIESEGAYANLTMAAALDRSRLSDADRRFVTDLVYGTTRMRRACDALVDRFVSTPPDPATRTLLRLGAYQLAFAGVPAHAAVGETVGARAEPHARLRERRAAQGVDDADGVAVGVGAPELPRLDRRHGSSPSSARTTRTTRWSG